MTKLTAKQLKEAQKIFAARAGSTKSPNKTRTARENGKLGGRPRKERD